MRSDFWFLNFLLAVILALVLTYIVLGSRVSTYVLKSHPIVLTRPVQAVVEERIKPRDIKSIYGERDLFGTYIAPVRIQETPHVPPVPKPPKPKQMAEQPAPTVQFLEPMPIQITGIIYSNDESKSQVSLLNTNTKKSDVYNVGDKVADAYIVRILPKKIITIRSNGQKETVYMYAKDAQDELKAINDASWAKVVQKISEHKYSVSGKEFLQRIQTLAHFIDMIDATTAFKDGQSIGCRIGNMDKKSVGYSLGLMPGDLITSIAGIPPVSTSNRVNIYTGIQRGDFGKSIKIEILRKKKKLEYEYTVDLPEKETFNDGMSNHGSNTNDKVKDGANDEFRKSQAYSRINGQYKNVSNQAKASWNRANNEAHRVMSLHGARRP